MSYNSLREHYVDKPRMVQQILDPISINGDYETFPSTNSAVVHTKINEVSGINYGTTYTDEVISGNAGVPRSIVITEPSCFNDKFKTAGNTLTIPNSGGASSVISATQSIDLEASDSTNPIWSEFTGELVVGSDALFPLLSTKAAPGKFIFQLSSTPVLQVGSVINVTISGEFNGTIFMEAGIYDQVTSLWTVANNNTDPLGFTGPGILYNASSTIPMPGVNRTIGGMYFRLRSNLAQTAKITLNVVAVNLGTGNIQFSNSYLHTLIDQNTQLSKWDVSKMSKIAWSTLMSNTAATIDQDGNIYCARGNGGQTAASMGLTPEFITQLNAFVYSGPAKHGSYCHGMTRIINYVPHLKRLLIREDPIVFIVESPNRNPFLLTQCAIYQGFSDNAHYPKIFPAYDPLMPQILNLIRHVNIPCENPEHTEIIKDAVLKLGGLLKDEKFLAALATGADTASVFFPRVGKALSTGINAVNHMVNLSKKDKPIPESSIKSFNKAVDKLSKITIEEGKSPVVKAAAGSATRRRKPRRNRQKKQSNK